MAGVLTGRWALGPPIAACAVAAALLGGAEAGGLGALTAAGFMAGVYLHRVVAEVSVR